MSTNGLRKVVDMIPIMSNGDFKKIYDHGVVEFNNIILSVANQLYSSDKAFSDFKNLGCYENLLKIYFSQELDIVEIQNEINEKLSSNRDYNIIVTFDYADELRKHVNLKIVIEDIPNFEFTADIKNTNGVIQIVNPNFIGIGGIENV